MPRHRVSARARIDAPSSLVYNIVADYHQHHPRILPDAFKNLVVERGGIGAGTQIRPDLRVGGQTKRYHYFVRFCCATSGEWYAKPTVSGRDASR